MLRSIAAQYHMYRYLRASSALGRTAARRGLRWRARLGSTHLYVPGRFLGLSRSASLWVRRHGGAIAAGTQVLVERRADAFVRAATSGADVARVAMRRAAAKARTAWIDVTIRAVPLCAGFARLSGHARRSMRELAAPASHRLGQWLTAAAALTRTIAARHGRRQRDGAFRYALGPAFRFCRAALASTPRSCSAITRPTRLAESRLAGAPAAVVKPRFQSACRFAQRVMVKAGMEWIAGITAAVIVAVCGMFVWMSWHARDIVIADTYVSASNLALSVQQFMARTTENVDLSLRLAAAEIAADSSSGAKDIHRVLVAQVRRSPQITSILLIDPHGHVSSSSEKLAGLPINVAKKKYFTHAGSDVIRFSMEQPLTPRSDGKRIIFASRRIIRSDGRSGGVIAATISRDYIQRFLSTLHVGAHGSIALHAIDGTMLLRQPAVGDEIGKNFSATPLFRDWLPWASSGVFPTDDGADGLRRIVGYQRVERLPLVAAVALSQDEVLANWRRATFWQIGIGGLILVLSGLTACALHQQLSARRAAHRELRETVGELENARRGAEESSRVKSQFMANMSHELRTPLNAILGFSEVIRDAYIGPLDVRYQAYAQDIHSSGQHLLGLINDVLDLSKVEAGRLALHEERVDLAKLAGDCERLLADRFRNARLALAVELPPRVPCVRGDEIRLKQILLNLLSNAAKFTPVGGRVVLKVEETLKGGVLLSVADTGVGMRPEEIPLALQPFRQVDNSLSRRYDGAGLGLPLARTLTELHGGKLAIESAPGRGTKVSIRLPARRVIRDGEAAARRSTLGERHRSPRAAPIMSRPIGRGPQRVPPPVGG